MEIINYLANGKPSINSKVAFYTIFNKLGFSQNHNLTNYLKSLDELVFSFEKSVTSQALSNCHGDWYEWLLNIVAWKVIASNKTKYILVSLPNVTSFSIFDLYKPEVINMVNKLKDRANKQGVQLITSNPDFVLINKNVFFDSNYFNFDSSLDQQQLAKMDGAYTNYIGKCDLHDVIGYLSVKHSLRPDRRLQIAHEGSLMKAIYSNLCNTKYSDTPNHVYPPLKYYAATSRATEADLNGLKTIATHSLANPDAPMVTAVDKVFICSTVQEAASVFSIILN